MNVCLLKAIRNVARMDAEPLRIAIFEDVKSRNFLIRSISRTYELVKGSFIGTLAVALYGCKSFIVPVFKKKRNASILSTATYPNEEKQIAFIKECIGAEVVSSVSYQISPQSFFAVFLALKDFKSTCKYFRIIHQLKKRYEFMPLCRIASTIGFYLRYQLELSSADAPKAVLIASNYSPDSSGLQWAARAHSIKSIFIPHAAIPLRKWMPPLEVDLAILDGPAALDTYRVHGKVRGGVVFRGLPGSSFPMSVSNLQSKEIKVGIFLTALTDKEVLERLLLSIRDLLLPSQIVLRPHPVQIVNHDFSDGFASGIEVVLSKNNSLLNDISRCDLIFIGDSSVHLEVLKAGKPTVYVPLLDRIYDDYYGFWEKRITYRLEDFGTISLNEIIDFYSGDWNNRFRYYDPTYLKESVLSNVEIRQSISNLIDGVETNSR